MSVQVAMLAGMAAMSAYSAVRKGQAEGDAMDAAAGSARLGAAGSDVEASETKAAAQNEELQRRTGLAKLLSANRGEASGRGYSPEQGSSYDVIADYNKEQNDRDVQNLRFMAESRVRRLSFAKGAQELQASQYSSMAGQARFSGYLNAGMALGSAGFKYFGIPASQGGGLKGK